MTLSTDGAIELGQPKASRDGHTIGIVERCPKFYADDTIYGCACQIWKAHNFSGTISSCRMQLERGLINIDTTFDYGNGAIVEYKLVLSDYANRITSIVRFDKIRRYHLLNQENDKEIRVTLAEFASACELPTHIADDILVNMQRVAYFFNKCGDAAVAKFIVPSTTDEYDMFITPSVDFVNLLYQKYTECCDPANLKETCVTIIGKDQLYVTYPNPENRKCHIHSVPLESRVYRAFTCSVCKTDVKWTEIYYCVQCCDTLCTRCTDRICDFEVYPVSRYRNEDRVFVAKFKCKGAHDLQKIRSNGWRVCDECKCDTNCTRESDQPSYNCLKCDYDICLECAQHMQKYNFNKLKFAIYSKCMQYVNHYGYKIKYMSEYDIDGWLIACRIMIVILLLLGVIFNYVMSG